MQKITWCGIDYGMVRLDKLGAFRVNSHYFKDWEHLEEFVRGLEEYARRYRDAVKELKAKVPDHDTYQDTVDDLRKELANRDAVILGKDICISNRDETIQLLDTHIKELTEKHQVQADTIRNYQKQGGVYQTARIKDLEKRNKNQESSIEEYQYKETKNQERINDLQEELKARCDTIENQRKDLEWARSRIAQLETRLAHISKLADPF